jgi:hypothetical protein
MEEVEEENKHKDDENDILSPELREVQDHSSRKSRGLS